MIFFLIAFLACLAGSICGMGGGVIIKPVLDACAAGSVSQINFLSGCTVLCMSGWSVGKALAKRESLIDLRLSTWLALGAAAGGVLGKQSFSLLAGCFADADRAGAVQAGILLLATLVTFIYTRMREHLPTRHVQGAAPALGIGFVLGFLGAFLGIGGGPFNVAALTYFFSMDMKTAAQNSLYIIVFSQATGLAELLAVGGVPAISGGLLLGMALCGILGSEAGRRVNRHLSPDGVGTLLQGLMVIIMGISIYNIALHL